ncbi:hypothetical protein M426DRAFT_318315 [Hypoxylon sp. CI-4A]|nr:hypothetical protein M426DRAFT_318315 [Hypoxylon sp. CI-4A]
MAGPAVKQQRRIAPTKSKVTTPKKQPANSSISNFARVSKPVTKTDVKKENAVTTTPTKNITLEALTPASRKRKVIASIEDSSADESPKKVCLSAVKQAKTIPSQPAKRGRPSKKAQEPILRKRIRSPSASDTDESAVNAGTLFKRLCLESSPSRCSSPLTANTSVIDSDTDIDSTPKGNQLPIEVLSLINLHSALLKTLTLHYAHNGSHVPADLRTVCPNVARAWGKKRITDADIRICLGVLSLSPGNAPQTAKTNPLFSLFNYGRGKICIEIDAAQHSSRHPLDEKKLNGLFRDNVSALWARFVATNSEVSYTTFASTLPKAPVTLSESVIKAAPVLGKGQRRLEELKHGIAIKKQEKEAKQQPPQQKDGNVPMTNADGTKMSLLDRIRLKSLQKAAMPAGNLTPEQLERRGALQRAPEVAALLGMLSRSSGESRISFTMAVTLQKLKDSFRMGISREEGVVCVRLLAKEIAPEWIRVITIAGRENVVVETDRQPSKVEVETRVRGILERE